MLKRILFAVAPLMLIAGSVTADDNLLASIASMDLDHKAEVADVDELGLADVESLLDEGEESSDEDAIAACFRRVGYGYGYGFGRSHSYRSYGYRSYCHTPVYRSYCHTPVYNSYYAPSYHCYTPVYTSYWGCW